MKHLRQITVDMEEEALEPPSCPTCGGEAMKMGSLGRLTWYRCRQCGMDYNEKEQA